MTWRPGTRIKFWDLLVVGRWISTLDNYRRPITTRLDNHNDIRNKFRRGTATEDEKETYFRLVMSSAYDVQDEEEWRAVWHMEEEIVLSAEDLVRRDQILDRLLSDIVPGAEVHAEIVTERAVLVRKPSWAGIAAACMLLCGLARVDQGQLPAEYVVMRAGMADSEVLSCGVWPSEAKEKKEILSIRTLDERFALPDGSMVLLNRGSHMSYGDDFNAGSREVMLAGEAFFEVRHDPSQPFRVRSKNIITTVVGTSFDVKTKGDEIVITVMRGQVRVSDSTRVFGVVNANQQMVMNTRNQEHYQRELNSGEEMFWESELLILGEIPFGEAMRRIGRRFKVEIDVTNPALKECVINASILPTEDVHDIVAILSKTVNAHMGSKGDHIWITGGSCR